MNWYVYILRCKDNSLYTGYTNNVEKRVEKHNAGTGAKYTRSKFPVTLVYSEKLNTKSDAMRREIAIKRMSKNNKEKLVSDYKIAEIRHQAQTAKGDES